MRIRVAIACCCLVFAVSFSCAAFFYVQRVCEDLMEKTEAALLSSADEEDAARQALALCEDWDRRSALFCAFVHHRDADALQKRFLQVRKQAERNNYQALPDALTECWLSLRVLREGEKPNLSNIF